MGGLSNPGNAIIVGDPVAGNLLKSGGGLLVEDSGSPGGGGISSVTNIDGSITVSTVSGVVTLSVDNGFHRTVLLATTSTEPGNIPGTYFNGPNNDGVGATFTCTASSIDVDGVGSSVGNTYVINNQASSFQNGLYVATSVTGGHLILTRLANFNNASNIAVGDVVHVLRGQTHAGAIFYQNSTVTAVGTSAITFVNSFSAGSVIFSALTVSGASTLGAVTATTINTSGNISSGTSIQFQTVLQQINNDFRFDDAPQSLSIGRGDTVHNATVEAVSSVQQTIAGPTSATATLNMVTLLSAPAISPSQYPPTLGNPTSPNISEILDPSGPYIENGSLYSGRIWSWDGSSISTFPCATVSFIDNNTGANFDIGYSWSNPSITTNSVVGWYIGLSINGGPEAYIFINNPSPVGYIDTTGVYPDPLGPSLYGDYLANNTVRNYQGYTYALDINSNPYYSAFNDSYSFNDDNSFNLFRVLHSSGGNIKVLGDPAGSPSDFSFTTALTAFIEDSLVWVSDTTVTPTTYGYTANGGDLNLSYDFYNEGVISGGSLFSSSFATAATIDPNDGNDYYISLSVTGQTATYRVLRSGGMGGAQDDTASSFNDVSYSNWSGSSVVTPNSYVQPAGWFTKTTTSLTDTPTVVAQSIDPSTPIPTYAFKDNNGNTVGTLGVIAGALVYRGSSGTVTTIAPA